MSKCSRRWPSSLKSSERWWRRKIWWATPGLTTNFMPFVYELSENRTLLEILAAVKNKMRPLALQVTPILSRLLEDHMEILAAFQERDADRAEAAFRNHNLKMIEQIKQNMNPDEWEEVRVEYGVGKKCRNSDIG